MINVLGLELDTAVALIQREGCKVNIVETASRKGVDGDSRRVVRQRTLANGEAELVYAVFKTGCAEKE